MQWYIKLHRETIFSEIWSKPPEWYKIWNWILISSRYEDGNNNVPKWCVLTNYEYISQQTFIKKRVIENCMRWLKESGMVVVHKRTRLVLIEVRNWDRFQTTSGTQTEHERSTNGDASGTIIEERRKKKEELYIWATRSEVIVELNNVIIFWNSKFKEKRRVTEDLKKEYLKVRKTYSKEDIETALQEYYEKKKDSELQYRLDPIRFFTQRNWFKTYL